MTDTTTSSSSSDAPPDAPDPAAPPYRGRLVAGGVLIAVIALAVGLAAGLFGNRLMLPGNDSPEAGFARDMGAHHAQAVEMAMIAHQGASRPDVRRLAYDIALTQQGQIGIMDTWRRSWGASAGSSKPMAWMPNGGHGLSKDGRMPGMASSEQLERLRKATGPQLDILFLQLMYNHHVGGVHMVDAVLAAKPLEEVRVLAARMKQAQLDENSAMAAMLTTLGSKPVENP